MANKLALILQIKRIFSHKVSNVLLSEFNHLDAPCLIQHLQHCVKIPRWAEQIVQQRPYSSTADLLETAAQAAQSWQWSEISAALHSHPKIGEKAAEHALSDQEQAFSAQEQAAVTCDPNTTHALYQGNLAYEKKYGFIFLIRAAGLDQKQILSALHQRLNHDTEIEKVIVHQQLCEIALRRLTQELAA